MKIPPSGAQIFTMCFSSMLKKSLKYVIAITEKKRKGKHKETSSSTVKSVTTLSTNIKVDP